MNIKNNQKGFTIVELLIVIVVIAILAAISVVAYTGIQNRAKTNSGQTLASQVAKKAQAYYSVQGTYPSLAQITGTTVPEATVSSSLLVTATNTDVQNGKAVVYTGGSGQTKPTIQYWDSTIATPALQTFSF